MVEDVTKQAQNTDLSCSKCDFVTKTQTDMETHVLEKHQPQPVKEHKCNQCDFVTNLEPGLSDHIKAEHITHLKCSDCDKLNLEIETLKAKVILKDEIVARKSVNRKLIQKMNWCSDFFKSHNSSSLFAI